jgi:hypothetical protein
MANLHNHPFALTLKQSALQPAHTLVISGNAARLSSRIEWGGGQEKVWVVFSGLVS